MASLSNLMDAISRKSGMRLWVTTVKKYVPPGSKALRYCIQSFYMEFGILEIIRGDIIVVEFREFSKTHT